MKGIGNKMKKYPIHRTCPGPDFGKPAKAIEPNGNVREYHTCNPILEGRKFQTEYGEQIIEFEVDMNFCTNDKLVVVSAVNVRKSRRAKKR